MQSLKIRQDTYQARRNPNFKWFVGADNDGSNYLHNDGVIRHSTYHDGGYTGWYRTREQARAALRLYRSTNS